jgi:hypothetical protein
MYKLGFCIYGPQCRYKHKPAPGEYVRVVQGTMTVGVTAGQVCSVVLAYCLGTWE